VVSSADLAKLGVLARFWRLGWIVADHGDAAAPPSPLTFTAEVAEEGKTLTGEIAEVANSLAISSAKAKGMGNIYVGATLFIGGLVLFLFLFFLPKSYGN